MSSYAGTLSLRTLSETTLPATAPVDGRAWDVRWAGSGEVYLSLGARGVVRMPIGPAPRVVEVMPPADKGGFFLSSRLGLGEKHLVAASPLGGFSWVPLQSRSTGAPPQRALANIMDVDARGDTVAILGADRGTNDALASDGTIAWTGSLSQGLTNFRPLMKGRATPGGKDMARCAFLATGGIRYMRDGSLVVLPGSEPGVYRYDARGKLLQTWDTGPLGIVDECAIEDTELSLLARDFGERMKWLSSRVIVDDILPLQDGPALLLRRVTKGVTTWELRTLPFRGKGETIAVPVTVPTPRGHMRGDVRGDQIVLLAYDAPLPKQKPAAPARLIVMSIRR